MAQMPIQSLATRANQFTGQGVPQGAPTAPPPLRGTPRAGTYLIDTGGISGGALRPGAMDQAQFKTLLAAARKPSTTTPETTLTQPAQPRSAPAVRTLTPAQLAALGAIEQPPAAPPAPAPATATLPDAAGPAPTALPMAETTKAPAATPTPAQPTPAQTPEVAAQTAAKTGTETPTEPNAATGAAPGPMPRARKGADGVWELPRLPDKDEREMLRGQKWRLVEDPDATRLFLGEDGKFGWDDFVDLINPLQHIPLVNVAYRAITGDEIDGAARLVDFAFGPVAGVSTAIDLAFRDVAGGSMASTAIAALFGKDEGGDALTEYTTAAANQIADSGRHGSHR